MDHIWLVETGTSQQNQTLHCLHCAHRPLCFRDLDSDSNRQQQALRLRSMMSQEVCNVRWTDHVTNVEIRCRTSKGPLSSAVTRRRLGLFGHVARLDRLCDTSRVLRSKIPRDWKRPKGRLRSTWVSTLGKDLSLNFGIITALKRAEDRASWKKIIRSATLA